MSSIILGNAQSDVRQGGQITLTQFFETYPGSGQASIAAGVTITIAGDGDTPVPATSTGVTQMGGSASLYAYTWTVDPAQAPGDYLVTWDGTIGEGPVSYVQTVTVAIMPSGAPAPGVYATVNQYQEWSGDAATPAALVSVTLRRASEDLDNILIGAVYQVNANGMPTDPMILGVFARACCAQCQFRLADNDPAGVKRQDQTTSMGGVNLTRAAGSMMLPFYPLAPQAASILHAAGVLGSAALINW